MPNRADPAGGPSANGKVRRGQAQLPAPAVVLERPSAPRWLQLTTFILSLAGLGVSIYLTIDHFTGSANLLGCPENATFNCAKVTTSPESIILGIPVAVLGLAFYVFMSVINSPWGWGAWQVRFPVLRWIRLGGIITGIVMVLYLVYTEVVTLNMTFCLYCTSVHIITFLLFALIVYNASAPTQSAVK